MDGADIVVIGGGMAGVSVGAELARSCTVIVAETEASAGAHATGRSAALFAPGYGAGPVRVLTQGSRDFFFADQGLTEAPPLVHPRTTLLVARPDQMALLRAALAADPSVYNLLSGAQVEALVPIIRPGLIEAALEDRASADIDVDAMLQRYLRNLRLAGGTFAADERVIALRPRGDGWEVETTRRQIHCGMVVNAAGAWADQVARSAHVAPIGLRPKRRTAAIVDAPDIPGLSDCPVVIDIAERFYFKPDAGKLLVSPAEETDVDAHDAYADDEALAEGIDRIMQLTTIEVTKAPRAWAGLRTFSPDRIPVIGFAAKAPAPFFWFAGQGGYGIQMAPGAAVLAASMITQNRLPDFAGDDLLAALKPDRFVGQPKSA